MDGPVARSGCHRQSALAGDRHTWRKRDPIRQLLTWLYQAGLIHSDEIARIEADISAEVDAAVAFAEAGTWEPVEELEQFTIMDRVPQ